MSEDLILLDIPDQREPIIKVFGVGGGGSNAVNHMYKQGIKDVGFAVCNTDSQALENSPVPLRIRIGDRLTEGRGAGNKPEKGREAAIENLDQIVEELSKGTKMVFITAGMGGGTGTGAAPIIAKAAKEQGILTVGIVTIPFRFEGKRRIEQAVNGIRELSQHVDSLIVINNEKLREIWGDLTVTEAFGKADDVLTTAAKGIAEIITVHGLINVDFADVQTVMSNSGVALMGSAQAEGEDRALRAVEAAIASPLLNNNNINGARNILLNICSGADEVTMDEIGDINDYVQDAAGNNADIIWGNSFDESLGKKILVTVIATGFETDIIPELFVEKKKDREVLNLKGETSATPISMEVKSQTGNYNLDSNHVTPQVNTQPTVSNQRKEVVEPVRKPATAAPVAPPAPSSRVLGDDEIDLDHLDPDVRKALERLRNLRKSDERKRPAHLTDDLESVESTPAFKRRINTGADAEDANAESKVSRYSLTDEDGATRLRSSNSFLHDNVD